MQPRAQGGPHTMANLVSLCGGHHDAVHAGRSQIKRSTSGQVVFTHADGRPYGAPPSIRDEPVTAAVHADRADASPRPGRVNSAATNPAEGRTP
ncbi:MAG: hypothetical protein H6709_11325 [Kofleriaceae bacterium]|nr:hypothetical protein [Myxococcales bacterium]MCB9562958.1 hypothetical protein [Kofleriaceae bacterium]MCB9572666.1 hypothetical protein [Kofleriaceae bacterium]